MLQVRILTLIFQIYIWYYFHEFNSKLLMQLLIINLLTCERMTGTQLRSTSPSHRTTWRRARSHESWVVYRENSTTLASTNPTTSCRNRWDLLRTSSCIIFGSQLNGSIIICIVTGSLLKLNYWTYQNGVDVQRAQQTIFSVRAGWSHVQITTEGAYRC